MDEQLQGPLRIALAELLRNVASAQVHLAAGTGADDEGYLAPDWRPFNSVQWLGVKLAEQAPISALPEEEELTDTPAGDEHTATNEPDANEAAELTNDDDKIEKPPVPEDSTAEEGQTAEDQ